MDKIIIVHVGARRLALSYCGAKKKDNPCCTTSSAPSMPPTPPPLECPHYTHTNYHKDCNNQKTPLSTKMGWQSRKQRQWKTTTTRNNKMVNNNNGKQWQQEKQLQTTTKEKLIFEIATKTEKMVVTMADAKCCAIAIPATDRRPSRSHIAAMVRWPGSWLGQRHMAVPSFWETWEAVCWIKSSQTKIKKTFLVKFFTHQISLAIFQ